MATNLCKTDLGTEAGTGEARYPMLGTGTKLLIIKKNSAWTNQEFFIPQDDEYFACALAYGKSSTYNSSYSDTKADGDAITNRVQQLWNGMSNDSWNKGHKSLFWYCARGWGPWFIKDDVNASMDKDLTYCRMILEMGGSRQLLHFNTRAFPCGQCSSFKAYLRFWCPSWLQGLERNAATHGLAFMGAWNNGARMYYNFSSTPQPPYAIDGADSGYCDFANGFANEGRGSAMGYAVTGTMFDPWDAHTSVRGSQSCYFYQRTLCYRHYDSSSASYTTDYYYNDHEITNANALNALKRAMMSGGVWCQIGFNAANLVHGGGNDTGQFPFTTMTAFASRVELRLVMTCAEFNK